MLVRETLVSLGGTPADAIAGFAGELFLLTALLAAAWRQFASRRLQYPVMNAVANQLKRFGPGHVDFPLDFNAVVCLEWPPAITKPAEV